ncbi:MAG: hypothetical protein IPN54_02400 [Bacteroidetes bacterium]|nr:hypothetical protein [Bacteroidota bacterium]
MVKIDVNGAVIWQYPMGGSASIYSYSINSLIEHLGEYFISGTYGNSIFIQGFNTNGILGLDRYYNGFLTFSGFSSSCEGGYIAAAADSGFFLTGKLNYPLSTPFSDYYLLRLDANGDTLWTKTYDNLQLDDSPSGILKTKSGGYLIFGNTKLASATSAEFYFDG